MAASINTLVEVSMMMNEDDTASHTVTGIMVFVVIVCSDNQNGGGLADGATIVIPVHT